MDLKKFEASPFKGTIQKLVQDAEAIRFSGEPVDVTFKEMVKNVHNADMETFLASLDIDLSRDSMNAIISVGDVDVRWIIPEVFRQALVLGYRGAPIWPNIIAAEEQMKGLTTIMPALNMSDAVPKKINEGETIPLGNISYASKSFRIFKVGRGIKITDEVRMYSSLNLVSIFLRDFGVKLGHATDSLAIDTLINGEQSNGSESAPVIGVASAGTKTYSDLLTLWLRMGRIGRTCNTVIGGETAAKATFLLDEFRKKVVGTPMERLTIKTPIPDNTNYFLHGNVPSNQEIVLDPSAAMIKFNGFPLKIESERIVSNQTEAFYVSLQLGFAKLFRDAALVLDSSKAFSSFGFPTYLDIDSAQNVTFS